MKVAVVLGAGGQDGSYACDILIERGYTVYGVIRRSSQSNTSRLKLAISRGLKIYYADVTDTTAMISLLCRLCPNEVYNFADQDHIGSSYSSPSHSYEVTGAAVGRLLEAMRIVCNECMDVRFFQPISATIFGEAAAPQTELSPLSPQSPYACAKAFALHLCRYHREHNGVFVSTAIYYNHDSTRRKEEYLLNKICRAAVRIANREQTELVLGNLNAKVDIGYARDYAGAAISILSLDKPDDFIIGSGRQYAIGELAGMALYDMGIPESVLREDPSFPPTKGELFGDISKAAETFNWRGGKSMTQLIRNMTHDFARHDLSQVLGKL